MNQQDFTITKRDNTFFNRYYFWSHKVQVTQNHLAAKSIFHVGTPNSYDMDLGQSNPETKLSVLSEHLS